MNLKRRVVVGLFLIAGLLALPASASAIKFAPSPGSPVTFASPNDVINDFAVADFNGDGKDDIVSVGDPNKINVKLANVAGDGFDTAPGSPFGTDDLVSTRPTVRTGDLDGDTDIDLVTVSRNSTTSKWEFETFLGDGTGDFEDAADYVLTAPNTGMPNFKQIVPGSSSIGDINLDGIPDIVTGMEDHHYMVAVGDGTGQFALTAQSDPNGIDIPTSGNDPLDTFVSTTIGDFDGNGRNDVAFVLENLGFPSGTPHGIYQALKSGGNLFDPGTLVASGFGPIKTIAAINLNHDSFDDASFTVPFNDQVQTLAGFGGGLGTNPADPSSATFAEGSAPWTLAVADLNLDGNEDVAAAQFGSNSSHHAVAVARSGGDGTIAPDPNSPFALPPIGAQPFFPTSVASGDFNGDGAPDLASDSSSSQIPQARARGIDVLLAQPDPVATPTTIGFLDTNPGNIRSKPVHIKNDGALPVTLTGATVNAPFNVANGTCPSDPTPLLPGEECDLTAYYEPTVKGASSSPLTLTFNGSIDKTVTLTGRTGPATVTVDPTDLDFGEYVTSYAPDVKTFPITITSDGGADLSLGTPVFAGFDKQYFSIASSTCQGNIPTGNSCTIQVSFLPTGIADGFEEAQLTFPNANLASPPEIPVQGRGKQSKFSVTPASGSFGDAKIGTGMTRTSQTFVVARTGQISVPFNGASLTGPNADSFSITSNDCPARILSAATPCEIKVTFDPKAGAAGPRSANLEVNAFSSATPGIPKAIPLTGTATVDPPPTPTCLTDPTLCPPPAQAKLSLKLKSAGKVKPGKTLAVKATVKNTGDATASSIQLKTTVPGKLAKKPATVKVASLAAGSSITRTIKVKVKKSAKKGKKLKVKVVGSATGVAAKTATRTVKIS